MARKTVISQGRSKPVYARRDETPKTYVHLFVDDDDILHARKTVRTPLVGLPPNFIHAGTLMLMRDQGVFEVLAPPEYQARPPDYSLVRLRALYPSLKRTPVKAPIYAFHDQTELFAFRLTWESVP